MGMAAMAALLTISSIEDVAQAAMFSVQKGISVLVDAAIPSTNASLARH